MRPDLEIKHDAERALRLDGQLDPSAIAVAVNEGVVLLSGFARNDEEKWRAAHDVGRIAGVAAVANAIDVQVPPAASDPQLARQAADELRWALRYSHRFVRLVVRAGVLRLEGEVEWSYQKERAQQAVSRIGGLVGIANALRVEHWVDPAQIRQAFEQACKARR